MKQTRKYLIIAACMLMGVGLVLMAAGMTALNWNFLNLDLGGAYTERTYTAQAEDVTEIRVELHNMKVEVIPTDADRVVLHYIDNEEEQVVLSEENGVLTLRDSSGGWDSVWRQMTSGMFHGLRKGSFTTVVEIPRGLIPSLTLSTSNAWVNVKDASFLELSVTSSNGKLTLSDIRCKSLSADTSNAAIALNETIVEGAASIVTSNGTIDLQRLTATAFDATTSNAAIHVQNLKAQHIALATSNGKISGTVLGDSAQYSVTSGTSNGNSNIAHLKEDPFLSGSLSAFTSNADIELVFEKK